MGHCYHTSSSVGFFFFRELSKLSWYFTLGDQFTKGEQVSNKLATVTQWK